MRAARHRRSSHRRQAGRQVGRQAGRQAGRHVSKRISGRNSPEQRVVEATGGAQFFRGVQREENAVVMLSDEDSATH